MVGRNTISALNPTIFICIGSPAHHFSRIRHRFGWYHFVVVVMNSVRGRFGNLTSSISCDRTSLVYSWASVDHRSMFRCLGQNCLPFLSARHLCSKIIQLHVVTLTWLTSFPFLKMNSSSSCRHLCKPRLYSSKNPSLTFFLATGATRGQVFLGKCFNLMALGTCIRRLEALLRKETTSGDVRHRNFIFKVRMLYQVSFTFLAQVSSTETLFNVFNTPGTISLSYPYHLHTTPLLEEVCTIICSLTPRWH